MNYWQFRLRLYREYLKQWLDSIKQMSLAIVALFPLAISALVLFPFLAWGVLAESAINNELWIYTLWGYLLFVYCWMILQKDGILGVKSELYINSLPVGRSTRDWCELGLSLYGANLFILGPLFIFLVLFKHGAEQVLHIPFGHFVEKLAPATGLLILCTYYCISAVKVTRLPFFSLFILPLFIVPWSQELTKIQCLVLWCVAILIERVIPTPSIVIGTWLKGYYRLFFQSDMASPRAEGLRLVALLLMLIMLQAMFNGVHADVKTNVASFLSFTSALLMASSLFDTQAVCRHYRYYLTSLPISKFKLTMTSVSYVMLKALVGLAVIACLDIFELQHWALWCLFYMTSLLGILYQPKWFFTFPVVAAVLVLVLGS
ncbi:DUF6136 family protein [uncultured Paraglaciecola sp.]|uniref:DUF6136 family protein n=1 Tax=uncultured Paraglaciecola sp. TaxID=1765024 RepID=UPI00259748FC|nr:DUF6136 family protein [uncultured Paraglaciecola sp.]